MVRADCIRRRKEERSEKMTLLIYFLLIEICIHIGVFQSENIAYIALIVGCIVWIMHYNVNHTDVSKREEDEWED